jgi:serine/threonine protein kinase
MSSWSKLGPIPPEYIEGRGGKKFFRKILFSQGSCARCYIVSDMETKVEYACKIISKSTIHSKRAREQIASEVRIQSRMDHPNICKLIESWEDADNIYMLLEMCPHGDLGKLLSRRKRFTELEARVIMRQLLDACSYMHARGRGVIHLDLKINNILMTCEDCCGRGGGDGGGSNDDDDFNNNRCVSNCIYGYGVQTSADKQKLMDTLVCKICDFGISTTLWRGTEDDDEPLWIKTPPPTTGATPNTEENDCDNGAVGVGVDDDGKGKNPQQFKHVLDDDDDDGKEHDHPGWWMHRGSVKSLGLGTPNYIAPEVLDWYRPRYRAGYGFKADVWSLGIILYVMIFGRPPFQGSDGTVKSTYCNIRAHSLAFPVNVDVSEDVKSLIRAMLTPNPEDRPDVVAVLKHPFFCAGDGGDDDDDDDDDDPPTTETLSKTLELETHETE